MKRNSALLGILVLVCSPALAQEGDGERVVVPARNSSHPRKVDVNMLNGSIIVKSYAGKEVIVEASGGSGRSHRERDRVPEGMHRIDAGPRGLTVEEENNVVKVRIVAGGQGNVTISVPPDTSLLLRSTNGGISVEGVTGEIDVSSHNGKVNLTNVAGSILANTMNGTIKATLDRVEANKPLSFSSMNGTIDVTLPADTRANVKLRTDNGHIYSDFEFKPGAGGVITERNNTSEGKFKVKMDKTITGTINGGGTEASFKTFNGTIYLRMKK